MTTIEHIKEIGAAVSNTIKTLITKSASKKFMVFVIATHMTYIGILESDKWILVAMIYIPLETALDWKALPHAAINQKLTNPPADPR